MEYPFTRKKNNLKNDISILMFVCCCDNSWLLTAVLWGLHVDSWLESFWSSCDSGQGGADVQMCCHVSSLCGITLPIQHKVVALSDKGYDCLGKADVMFSDSLPSLLGDFAFDLNTEGCIVSNLSNTRPKRKSRSYLHVPNVFLFAMAHYFMN